jgi:hypothetical protein
VGLQFCREVTKLLYSRICWKAYPQRVIDQ